jgi:16S rRNA (guanine527-N7)-methyltransferase
MKDYPDGWEGQLTNGLDQMGLVISPEQKLKLLDYLALLMKWNKAYNLTAIRDPDQMVSRQLLDSLSILPLVYGNRILDVGTGAGLPGIPLAICMPHAAFTLLDSNGKKTRFVQQCKMELGLDNLEVMQTRVELFESEQGFETITTRAFAALPKIVELTHRLMAESGTLLAMKGSVPADETAVLQAAGAIVDVVKLNPPVPGERHAIMIKLKSNPDR